MDRCALFVDAGYLLADGAMAVHGTRHREAVSWDYAGLLQLLSNLGRERTGLQLLRCYWYEATVEGRRTPEHDALADIPGLKLRLARIRPGRREGVDAQVHRDLMTLARNNAISDAIVISGDEDLAQVVCDAQDLGVRVTVVHVAVDGNWVISRTLRQECDDLIEISASHLRPYVNLIDSAGLSGGRSGLSESRPLANGQSTPVANGQAPVSNGQAVSSSGSIAPLPTRGGHASPPALPQYSGYPSSSPSPDSGYSSPGSSQDYPSPGSSPDYPSSGPSQDYPSSTPSQDYPAAQPEPAYPSAQSSPEQSPSYPVPATEAGYTTTGPQPQVSPPPVPAPTPAAASSGPAALPPSSPPSTASHAKPAERSSTGAGPAVQGGGSPYSSGQPAQHGPYTAPTPAPVVTQTTTLSDAVKAAHKEGYEFGESVARDAPALWLEAVLARKPRMPSDLEARLLQGSSLPIDFLLHDEVRHALRRGFWDALERSRR
ncbi:NYN domain-containing protein [Bailinhaonella thermotolerans]|uniref:NYN domain-containing protein n=1 Tax=Bailinhaonella thermotolerans TaxID=1070861 RepID=A0A3A4AQJ2_9ACTN|nr:NYN domain-containing protein [Bailinhaonella thermotolerans]RJL31986.1 NYN domain-containing protein [Bailinhaonella thermotolerans]